MMKAEVLLKLSSSLFVLKYKKTVFFGHVCSVFDLLNLYVSKELENIKIEGCSLAPEPV
jgi:hypothetical protein